MATTTTPLFAVVGATDLAVERVRAAAANASAVQAQFDPVAFGSQAQKALLNQAQEAPTKAAARALEVAGRAEAAYEDLAERGKQLVDRVRSQASTQEFLNQAGNTLSRGRAAVTVARKAADDTASAILGTLIVGRREAGTLVNETIDDADTAVQHTRASATKTATTARERAAATKSAAKGAQTSVRKTASKGTTAAKAATKKVGN